VDLHERQASHADELLKFRFAKGTKEPILLREAEFEWPDYAQGFVATAIQDTRVPKARARRSSRRRPVERAEDFSYEITRRPFNPACEIRQAALALSTEVNWSSIDNRANRETTNHLDQARFRRLIRETHRIIASQSSQFSKCPLGDCFGKLFFA
jgi:hypothetical protein